MGLVIHAPAGPPPGTATKHRPPGNAGETHTGDIFAALLAELFAPADTAAPDSPTGAANELPLPADGRTQDDADGSDGTNSALAPAIAALQAGLAPGAATSETEATVAGDSAVADVPATVQPPAPAVPPGAFAATDGVAEAAMIAETAPAGSEPAPTEATTAPAADVAPAPAVMGAAPSRSTSEQVDSVESTESADGPGPPKDADSQPADSPQAQPATEAIDSVVRSVGNAEHDPSGKSSDAPGHQDAKPQPNASAQGIAHAADNSAVGHLRTETAADAPAANSTQSSPATQQPLPPAVEQVAHAVIEHGGGEARIHLHPEELGEVTIHVHTEGDAVRVEVHAERSEAMHLLRDSTTDLSALLGSRGLNLSGVHVGLGGQGSRGSHGYEPERLFNNRPGRGDFAALMGIGESSAATLHNRVRTAYNPDGAHVYRI